jgi:hypothetical protein
MTLDGDLDQVLVDVFLYIQKVFFYLHVVQGLEKYNAVDIMDGIYLSVGERFKQARGKRVPNCLLMPCSLPLNSLRSIHGDAKIDN